MTRPNPVTFFAFLLAILVAMGGAALMKGGFFISRHEGDTLHLVQIVFRMVAGEVPHVDFMTPIGALAFWPIAFFVERGMGIGMAILSAQVAFAAFMLPALWWVGYSRLSRGVALLFGLIVMGLLLALVYGEAQRSISFSMHYNRWAWAATFIAVVAALLPPVHPNRPAIDGVVIGTMMAVLVMIKVTYFAAFALPIILALVLGKRLSTLLFAVLTGGAIAVAITLFVGVDYWLAYIGDLQTVANSDVRPQPGEPLSAVMGAPAYIAGSLVAIAGVIFVRQSGRANEGLILLLLVPGFFYVTFQNFGNDPQWLLLLGVVLLALLPTPDVTNSMGLNLRTAQLVTAAMALALIAPSFANMLYSPFRHLRVDETTYAPILPRGGIHTDLQTADLRALRVDGRVALDGEGSGLEQFREAARRDEQAEFMGEVFPYCTTELGLPAMFDAVTRDLEEAGLAEGKRLLAADLFSSYWLYGSLERLEGGAPWYYGGLPGFESADYLLVPFCPVSHDLQVMILKAVTERGTDDLREIRRTPLYILFEKTG